MVSHSQPKQIKKKDNRFAIESWFLLARLIDHLQYDVNAQRLLVVVVKFAGKHHFWLMIG